MVTQKIKFLDKNRVFQQKAPQPSFTGFRIRASLNPRVLARMGLGFRVCGV